MSAIDGSPGVRGVKEDVALAGLGNPVLVIILCLVAGLLVGGVWASYQNGSKALTVVLAALAAMAVLFAVLTLAQVM